MIYKLFTGNYIDLSKIITISDAHLVDVTYFKVGFIIECQLLQSPLEYSERIEGLNIIHSGNSTKLLMVGGDYVDYKEIEIIRDIKAVADLQEKIDKVVSDWVQFKSKA